MHFYGNLNNFEAKTCWDFGNEIISLSSSGTYPYLLLIWAKKYYSWWRFKQEMNWMSFRTRKTFQNCAAVLSWKDVSNTAINVSPCKIPIFVWQKDVSYKYRTKVTYVLKNMFRLRLCVWQKRRMWFLYKLCNIRSKEYNILSLTFFCQSNIDISHGLTFHSQKKNTIPATWPPCEHHTYLNLIILDQFFEKNQKVKICYIRPFVRRRQYGPNTSTKFCKIWKILIK